MGCRGLQLGGRLDPSDEISRLTPDELGRVVLASTAVGHGDPGKRESPGDVPSPLGPVFEPQVVRLVGPEEPARSMTEIVATSRLNFGRYDPGGTGGGGTSKLTGPKGSNWAVSTWISLPAANDGPIDCDGPSAAALDSGPGGARTQQDGDQDDQDAGLRDPIGRPAAIARRSAESSSAGRPWPVGR